MDKAKHTMNHPVNSDPNHRWGSISLILVTTMSIATIFSPPFGIITSAQRLLGSTNSSCIGLTVSTYCFMTESIVRPRSNRSDAGVSEVFHLHRINEYFNIH